MTYINRIDVLRFFSILLVVLFHTKSSFFSGGYIGVDIFLVISGYLIFKIFSESKYININTVLIFLKKRFWRIAPLYFFVILVSIPLTINLILPIEFDDFKKTIIYSGLFSSNLFFYFNNNYFDDQNFNPLLHLWSIGLEIQFYIIFSFFFYIVTRWLRLSFNLFLFISLLISLFLSQFGGNLKFNFPYIEENFYFFNSMNGSFFLIVTRFWEFIIGAMVFRYESKIKKIKLKFPLIDTFFLLGIVCCSILFNNKTYHPGLITLVPCLLAGFLLVENNKDFLTKSIFENTILSKLGILSFGIYLWHYLFFKSYELYVIRDIFILEYFILILITILVSYISYISIEKPFRNRKNLKINIFSYGYFLSIFIFFVYYLSFFTEKDFYKDKTSEEINDALQIITNLKNPLLKCRGKVNDDSCVYGNSNNITTLLWGDSHLNQISHVFKIISENNNFGVIDKTVPGCAPILNTRREKNTSYNCKNLNDKIFNEILNNPKINNIVLHASWRTYIDNNQIKTVNSSNIETELINQVLELSKEKKIILIGNVPVMDINIPKTYARMKIQNKKIDPNKFTTLKSNHDIKTKVSNKIFKKLQNRKNITVIYPSDYLCENNLCLGFMKNKILYRDNNHLSFYGGLALFSEINKLFLK